MKLNRILIGDVFEQCKRIRKKSVHCVVTSPPYWALRDYQIKGQIGLEKTPEQYIETMVRVFRSVRRVLRDDGVVFLNIGDTYQDKSLVGIPWMLALALKADGWYLRQQLIWEKPNCTPTSISDRCTNNYEPIYILTKSPNYYFDIVPLMEKTKEESVKRSQYEYGGSKAHDLRKQDKEGTGCRTRVIGKWEMPDKRFPRAVWKIPVKGIKDKHFAIFPMKLPSRCIQAGTSEHGCCPHCGACWIRRIEKKRIATRPGTDTKTTGVHGLAKGNRDPLRHIVKIKTVGWKPGCKCKKNKPIPCIVFDPFLGSGTTARAAKRLHRDWIGIELNPESAKMARRRIENLRVGLFPVEMQRD